MGDLAILGEGGRRRGEAGVGGGLIFLPLLSLPPSLGPTALPSPLTRRMSSAAACAPGVGRLWWDSRGARQVGVGLLGQHVG